jgi:hypothetical protein
LAASVGVLSAVAVETMAHPAASNKTTRLDRKIFDR